MNFPAQQPDAAAARPLLQGFASDPPSPTDLGALYDAYGGPVYRLALRLCRSNQEADDLSQRVRHALETIPPNQRQVLELAYYEGLSQSAIGQRLNLPLGTVKTRSRQDLIHLRELLIDFRTTP